MNVLKRTFYVKNWNKDFYEYAKVIIDGDPKIVKDVIRKISSPDVMVDNEHNLLFFKTEDEALRGVQTYTLLDKDS